MMLSNAPCFSRLALFEMATTSHHLGALVSLSSDNMREANWTTKVPSRVNCPLFDGGKI